MIDPAEPKFRQIEFIDNDIDYANRIVLADQPSRHSGTLHPIGALNEAPHPIPPQNAWESYPENHFQQRVFTQPGSKAALEGTSGFGLQSGHATNDLVVWAPPADFEGAERGKC
jgi:hypothetical protein